MWKEPGKLIDWLSAFLWHNKDELWELQYPEHELVFAKPEVAAQLRQLTVDVLKIIKKHHKEPAPSAKFRRELRHVLLPIAKQIEEGKDWSSMTLLYEASQDVRLADERLANIVHVMTLTVIQLLLGSERRMLIGTRGGLPAWKDVTDKSYRMTNLVAYQPSTMMRYVDQADSVIYHQPSQATSIPTNVNWPDIELGTITSLLEDAYYKQRYVVHPQGAYVRLQRFGPLTGLKLRVKPGLTDPNYLDFIAVFEASHVIVPERLRDGDERKQFLFVLDGAFASGQVKGIFFNQLQDAFARYLGWVVAMIYHDLVTSDGIRVAASSQEASDALELETERPEHEPSWIFIPRKHGLATEPRVETASTRQMDPHRVSGHIRKGNITEQHIEELKKFERETGLKVMHILEQNPGYTFVRPHVSPSGFDLAELPRFIHARLQSDIDRLMKSPSIKEVK